MSTKKKQTFSKSHLKVPSSNTTDITFCIAHCSQNCARKNTPKKGYYSVSDFTMVCADYKEKI